MRYKYTVTFKYLTKLHSLMSKDNCLAEYQSNHFVLTYSDFQNGYENIIADEWIKQFYSW